MKKTLLVSVFLLTVVANAQLCFAQVSIGPSAALSFNKWRGMTSQTGVNNPPYIAFQAGAAIQGQLSPHFALEGELRYAERGMKIVDSLADSNRLIASFRYAEVALNLKAYLGKSTSSRAFLFAGGYFGMGLSAKSIDKEGSVVHKEDIDFAKDSISRSDAGIQAGVGGEWKAGPGNISVLAFAQLGMIGINAEKHPFMDVNPKNLSFGIRVAYLFELGRKKSGQKS